MIFRAQAEQQTLVDGHLSRLQSAVSLGLEQINERVTIMENRLRAVSEKQDDVDENVKIIKEKVIYLDKNKSTTRIGRHHPGASGGGGVGSHRNKSLVTQAPHHICSEVKGAIKTINIKVDHIYRKMSGGGSASAVTNLTMASNELDSDGIDYYSESSDHDLDSVLFDTHQVEGIDEGVPSHHSHQSFTKKQFLKLFRRITLPFKKANKRLREMEDIRHRFTSSLDQMRAIVNTLTRDADRRYNDFYNMTMEMFDQQHRTLESYERQFASLQQCCKGTASDLSGFEARALSAFNRIENSFANWDGAGQLSQQQNQTIQR